MLTVRHNNDIVMENGGPIHPKREDDYVSNIFFCNNFYLFHALFEWLLK